MNNAVLWSAEAENDIDAIYEYYFEKSPLAASRIVNDIIDSTEGLVFAKQYQMDEYAVGIRRIIVRHYKVLYIVQNETTYIVRIFDSRQNPSKI